MGLFVIFDVDVNYATALSKYIASNMEVLEQVQVFSDVQMFLSCLEQSRVAFILISEVSYNKVKSELQNNSIPYAILSDDIEMTKDFKYIYKYQEAGSIVKHVNRLFGKTISQNEIGCEHLNTGNEKIITVISTSGSMEATLFEIAIAKYVGRDEPVLLINLDPISIVEKIMFKEKSKGLSEILYYYKQGKEDIFTSIDSVCMEERIIYIPKVEHYSDLFYMNYEDLKKLIKEATNTFQCRNIIFLVKNIDCLMEYCIQESTHVLIDETYEGKWVTNSIQLKNMLAQSGLTQGKKIRTFKGLKQVYVGEEELRSEVLLNQTTNEYLERLLAEEDYEDA